MMNVIHVQEYTMYCPCMCPYLSGISYRDIEAVSPNAIKENNKLVSVSHKYSCVLPCE